MTTEPVNPGNPYGATLPELIGGERLTGEALMMYISSRLNSLDNDVQALMGEMSESLARKAYINEVKEWADNLAAAKDAGNDEAVDELVHSFPEAPPGCREMKQELHQLFNSLCPTRENFTAEKVAEFKGRLDNVLDELNGQSEITMIRLQQLTAQRQVAIQFTTNVLSKFNQGFEAIVGNLR